MAFYSVSKRSEEHCLSPRQSSSAKISASHGRALLKARFFLLLCRYTRITSHNVLWMNAKGSLSQYHFWQSLNRVIPSITAQLFPFCQLLQGKTKLGGGSLLYPTDLARQLPLWDEPQHLLYNICTSQSLCGRGVDTCWVDNFKCCQDLLSHANSVHQMQSGPF